MTGLSECACTLTWGAPVTVQKLHFSNETFAPVFPLDSDRPHPPLTHAPLSLARPLPSSLSPRDNQALVSIKWSQERSLGSVPHRDRVLSDWRWHLGLSFQLQIWKSRTTPLTTSLRNQTEGHHGWHQDQMKGPPAPHPSADQSVETMALTTTLIP